MQRAILFISTFLLVLQQAAGAALFCYYKGDSRFLQAPARYIPEKSLAKLCTHIIFQGAFLLNDEMIPRFFNDAIDIYPKLTALKKDNPNLKVLVNIDSWNGLPGPFARMAANDLTRESFIRSVLKFVQLYGFDGINLDWLYPGHGANSKPDDKKFFTKLIKSMKLAFEPFGYLQTAYVSGYKMVIDEGYEVEKLAMYLDFAIVQSIDLGPLSFTQTKLLAPIFSSLSDSEDSKHYSWNWVTSYWLSKGFPAAKIIMGIPTYAKSYKMSDSSENIIGSLSKGAGDYQPYTEETGFMAYYELCSLLDNPSWIEVWNPQQAGVYGTLNKLWVSYENTKSIGAKADFIKSKNLGGVWVWSADYDDFSGQFCKKNKFPMLNAINKAIL